MTANNIKNKPGFQAWYKKVTADVDWSYSMGKTSYQVNGFPPEEMKEIKKGKYQPDPKSKFFMNLAEKNVAKNALIINRQRMILDEVSEGRLSGRELGMILYPIWIYQNHRDPQMTPEEWVWLYRKAGYLDLVNFDSTIDDPLTLYRGAHRDFRSGLAWTTSRYYAEAYARQHDANGVLYEATVNPDRLLAHYSESRFGDEYVVDTQGLEIFESSPQFVTYEVSRAPSVSAFLSQER
ncbi:hypothetical protein [Corynebacterium glyciniphilum]|uniref:hypothetical protein n=1 Tax=Corynebacterium glyciniphilum TaxID=1404244 RepID=UPI0026503350|nr:hypothetical protein [Corynebacterium glyciniphilum]MDN6707405.1 hypothetical protein [Corynebacterium glyciniphilum]